MVIGCRLLEAASNAAAVLLPVSSEHTFFTPLHPPKQARQQCSVGLHPAVRASLGFCIVATDPVSRKPLCRGMILLNHLDVP